LDLARDISDKQVVDRDGREIGRVDRVLIEVGSGQPPRVVALELGPSVLAFRLSTWLGRFVAGVEYALGFDEDRPVRISTSEVMSTAARTIHVSRAFAEMPAGTVEATLKRWMPRLPGAR